MENIGRQLILGGFVLIVVGGGIYLAARLGLPLGSLPGDIRIEGKGGGFYFPIVTCIVLSLLLTGILNFLLQIFRK